VFDTLKLEFSAKIGDVDRGVFTPGTEDVERVHPVALNPFQVC
jgi:hypothetical protein